MKKLITLITMSFFIVSGVVYAQDDLINKIKDNKSENANFTFTTIKQLDNTSIKDQGSSGTCWSYSGNSFLESEMYRKYKTVVNISEIYTARKTYEEKAKLYVLMDGAINYGDGGELHDVINMYKKYGSIPQEAYTGLINGATRNNFNAMQKKLKACIDSINLQKAPININWTKTFSSILDKYLGKVPETFTYKGKTYTPQSFAKEVIKLDPNDYVEIGSNKEYPYYSKFFLPYADNWSGDHAYNVHMTDLTDIIDYAIDKGYTVGWATDVSEPYFSWRNGIAYVPNLDLYNITPEQRTSLFSEPKAEKQITEDMRLQGFNDKTTTDDHGMHIVGLAKDQTGKPYYIVKNSWGVSNDFQGYLYVTKAYVQLKSTAILVNKEAIPKKLRKKLNI